MMVACLLMATSLSCTDRIPTVADRTPGPEPLRLSATLTCRMDVAEGSARCRREAPELPGGVSATILTPFFDFELHFSDYSYSAVDSVYRASGKLYHRMEEPIGTPDWQTVTGSKVFIEAGPHVWRYRDSADTSDPDGRWEPLTLGSSGGIRLLNPDGQQNFTAADQPYIEYREIIEPYEPSASREWRWHVPPEVKVFAFQAKVFTSVPSEQIVPDVPPDSVPAWVYAPENLTRDDSPFMAGMFPRNVVFVRFHEGATREEKQAAVDLVRGTVVGGIGSEYLIRVIDDGTTQPLFRAIDQLESLPQVSEAGPDPIISVLHLRPNDTGIWRKENWRLNPDSAIGLKWGVERVAGPSAWGCSVGDSTETNVAVVDAGFHNLADLTPNVASGGAAFGKWPSESHGTQVTSILAARGDNEVQMTGMMWQSRLHLHDPFTSTTTATGVSTIGLNERNLYQAVVAAGRQADIINLSVGIGWWKMMNRRPAIDSINPEVNPRRDTLLVQRYHQVMRRALDTLSVQYNRTPLLVIAAGNDTLDAFWSGITNVRDDYPAQVLVVGASARNNDVAHYSNRNLTRNLVELMGTGHAIGGLNRNNQIIADSGTSFAAPIVSGIAGLLKSFDPRLPADSLKHYLLIGAQRGGRTAGGIPIPNAYESLRAVAERNGAPLCGNRVWLENGRLIVNRDSIASRRDTLFQTPAGALDFRAFHGGKSIALWASGVRSQLYRWNAGVWAVDPDAKPDSVFELEDPFGRSRRSRSHDRDSMVITVPTETMIEVYIRSAETGAQRAVGALPVPRRTELSDGVVCTRERYQNTSVTCADSINTGSSSTRLVTYARLSPRGDSILVGYSIAATTVELHSDWDHCSGSEFKEHDYNYRCRSWRGTNHLPVSRLYWLPVAGGNPVLRVNETGVEYGNVGIADGPAEFMVERWGGRTDQVSGWHLHEGMINGDTVYVWQIQTLESSSTNTPCHIQFRHSRTGAVLQTIPSCPNGTPTISPDRQAESSGGGYPGASRGASLAARLRNWRATRG